MDFKKLAQNKLDEISGFKSINEDVEVDDLLEGLDLEIESVRKIDENQIELDLDDELDFEPVSKSNDQSIQNLFDGYIGEKNFIPNPYEYGPNATYRNVNEGIVYKKNEQNLWEAFVKDGKPGQQGPRGFAGGGTGVEEVKKISNEIVSTSIKSLNNKLTNDPPKGNVSWNSFNLFYKDTTSIINWDNILNEYATSAIKYIKDCGGKVFRFVYPAYRGHQIINSVFNGIVPDREFKDSDFNPSFLNASDLWFDYLESQDITSHLTLFWDLLENVHAVGLTSADYNTEFRSINTKTVRYMKNFAGYIANRYKNKKSISMYSIGNEYVWEELSPGQYFDMEQMTNIFNEINTAIKSADPYAKLTADLPGPVSHVSYARKKPQWYVDTYSYIFKNLDAWTVHIYYDGAYIGKTQDYNSYFAPTSANEFGYDSLEGILSILSYAARSEGKMFILGETGIGRSHETDSGIIKKNRIINAINKQCDYGMIWNVQANNPPVDSNQLNWWTYPGTSAVDDRANTYLNLMKYANSNNQDRLDVLESAYSDNLNFKYYPNYQLESFRVSNARTSFTITSAMATSGDIALMFWLKINSNLNSLERIIDLQGEQTNGGLFVLASTSGNTSWYVGAKDPSNVTIGSFVNATPILNLGEWIHVAYVYNNRPTSSFYDLYLNGTFWNSKIDTNMGPLSAGNTCYIAGNYANASGAPISVQDVAIIRSCTFDDIRKHMKGEVLPQSLIHIRALPNGSTLDLSRYNIPITARPNTKVSQTK